MAINTEAQLKEYIQRRLGHGVVKVELTDDQLDDAVMAAKEYWQMWVGQPKAKEMTSTGTTEYAKALIGSDVSYVTDVIFSMRSDGLTNIFSWADVEYNPYYNSYGSPNYRYSDLLQYMQHREIGRRITSSDRDWAWDEAQQLLIVTPLLDAGEVFVVIYTSTEMELSNLKTYEWRMFRDYALAQAMRTLGAIRMKYTDKPSATGSFSMDGDALWANAEALEMQIEDKMRNLQEPVPFWAQ
jgi:hypothetical protein